MELQPLYTNVYACYEMTPASCELLEMFSHEIAALLHEYPSLSPLAKIPSYFHVTTDYKNTIYTDHELHGYLNVVKNRMHSADETYSVLCQEIAFMESNVDGSIVIYAVPDDVLPYDFPDNKVPHVTLAQLPKPDALFAWRLQKEQIFQRIIDEWTRQQRECREGDLVQIDVSHMIVRGRRLGDQHIQEIVRL